MKNTIIHLEGKPFNVFGFNEEKIILSSKTHQTFESLRAAVVNPGMLEEVKVILLHTLDKIDFNEKEKKFTIHYHQSIKKKKQEILLEAPSQRESVATSISELKGWNKEVVEESKTKPLLLNLLAILGVPCLTWVFRMLAIDAQNGIVYETTGRRSGIKKLLNQIVSVIGPEGVIAIGVLVFAYMIYRAYQRYTHPASVSIFKEKKA